MNLFYMLIYKGHPIAYTHTYVEAMCYVDAIPSSMLASEKIWAKKPEDLCLPHAHDVPARVWEVLSEIDLNEILEGD